MFNAVFSQSAPNNYTADQFWPLTDPGYSAYASNVPLIPGATGYTVAVSAETDVVCALLQGMTYKAKGTLVFSHVFGRLGTFMVAADEGYEITGVSVKITPKVSGTYNLFAGNGKTDGTGWSAAVEGAALELAPSAPGSKTNDVYLVPGTYILTAGWTARKGDYQASFEGRTTTVDIPAGKVCALKATFGGNAAPITISVSLTPWQAVQNEFPI